VEYRPQVFENRVLRRIFGLKKDEVSRSWKALHNDELHNLKSSPSIIRIVKSWRMKWEASGSIKCWDVLVKPHNWQPLKKGSVSWS
jgi:hypothetical protein